ncbi:MAG: squalene/phytoene synthase family protein [Lactobacillaceae bacterium]|jgi:phytoene synthase|nr:squalene/phytoene synthase family protein [Lactobacillaceae bacterium]
MSKNIRKIIRKNDKMFFWGMRFLPKAKREAMYTLYAFFRHIDSIVDDEDMTAKEKKELINIWREEFDNIYDKKVPATEIGRKIYKNCMRFKLPKSEFLKLINGLSMDIPTPLEAPSIKNLMTYCRGVSGTPCNLSLRVLGCDDEKLLEDISNELGDAVRLTTILRDVKEDALAGHLYIPKELLNEAQIFSTDPKKVVTDKNLYIAREELAKMTQVLFDNSYRLIKNLDTVPARSMRGLANLYKRYFDIMTKRGWEVISPKPKVGKISRLVITAKSFLPNIGNNNGI